jgi:hypothetical protein
VLNGAELYVRGDALAFHAKHAVFHSAAVELYVDFAASQFFGDRVDNEDGELHCI